MSYQNFVQCRVVTPLSASATDVGVFDATAPYVLPPLDGGLLVLADSPTKPSKVEVIRYAYRTALGLYGVQRGQEGTTAQEWTGPVYAYQALMAGEFQSLLNSKVDKAEGQSLMTSAERTKLSGIAAGAQVNTVSSVAGKTDVVTLVKADVGLGNVDNTSDANKPVSTAQQEALNGKVDKVAGKGLSTNDFTSTLLTKLNAAAPLASPAFTGNPTAPTPAIADNDTSIATTAFVKAALAALVDSSPAALDTLNELAAALGNDPNFAATMATELGKKLDAASYTAADVLAKLKTVDGAGSGIDADLLDGKDSSEFVQVTSAGSATLTGVEPQINLTETDTNTRSRMIVSGGLTFIQAGAAGVRSGASSGDLYFTGMNNDNLNNLGVRHSGATRAIWHEGNDGAGSGLDADLLDGKHASEFLETKGTLLSSGLGLLINPPTGSANLEIGGTHGVATTPYIDFHSGATATDYDSRIIASGGNGVSGGGTLKYQAASHVFEGGKVETRSPSSASASLTLPHGTTPTTLVNGDMWTTTSGLYVRINGSTRDLYHAGNLADVGQPEAEAGTATARRAWTAQRVHQAVGAANAASATKLQTPRTINGVPFDGTANITVSADPTLAVMHANALLF